MGGYQFVDVQRIDRRMRCAVGRGRGGGLELRKAHKLGAQSSASMFIAVWRTGGLGDIPLTV